MADPNSDLAVAARSSHHGYAPVGAVVYCSYWQEHYTVLSHNPSGTVTVRWHGDARHRDTEPRETTHRTPLYPDDRIISTPPAGAVTATCKDCRRPATSTRFGRCDECRDRLGENADAIETAEFQATA